MVHESQQPAPVTKVDCSDKSLLVDSNGCVRAFDLVPGQPQPLPGTSVGIADLDKSPPHNGERHNGGDEIIILISGKIEILIDVGEGLKPFMLLSTGESCVITQGVWHKVNVLEKAKLVYITPGSDNEYRF